MHYHRPNHEKPLKKNKNLKQNQQLEAKRHKKRKRNCLWLIVFLLIVFLKTKGIFCSETSLFPKRVCFKKNCVEVELAITPEERAKGLMFRTFLQKNHGMLFIFPDMDYHSFWMKNTFIPLDIIWLDANQKVVFIHENAKPLSGIMTPPKKARYVLEINKGMAKKMGIRRGIQLEFLDTPIPK